MLRMSIAGGVAGLMLIGALGVAAAQSGPTGYLAPGSFDLMSVLPPAPKAGDPRDKTDRAIFRDTQKRFIGTPRWDMAINDVKLTPADLMQDFSCSVGIALTPGNAPKTAALVTRVTIDTYKATQAAKKFYNRKRPFLVDHAMRTCQAPEELKGSADYPSGHTTLGWTWATLLAGLAPDRATPILARGRAYGESRIVCGVHNYSAVEAGRLSSAATLGAVAGSPDFQSDFAVARAEIDALRRDPSTAKPGHCDAEATLVAQPML